MPKSLGLVAIAWLLFALLEVNASDIDCFVKGSCADSTEVGISFPENSNGCLQVIIQQIIILRSSAELKLQDCKEHPACFYFTYSPSDDLCVQFTECDNLVNSTDYTVSGHVR